MKNLIAELLHERDYNLKPLTYSVHHRGVLLADLVEAPLVKYADKDRYHETGLMNLWTPTIRWVDKIMETNLS